MMRSVVVMMFLLAQLLAAASVAAQPTGVRSGFVVRPDTVEVGDPFVLVVSIVVPGNARIEWPSIDDTSATVAMRSPVRVQTATDGTSRRETAEYELAAWDIGKIPVGLVDPVVRIGATTIRVPIAAASIFVKSVLPGDTTLHVPKPAKSLFPRVIPWWEKWWPALLVVAALLLLWWYRRRRRGEALLQTAKPFDPFARATHDFDRLDRLALCDLGEPGRAVALATEIVRSYVAARIPTAQLSCTTPELVEVVEHDERVPQQLLGVLLDEADAIKFARQLIECGAAKQLTIHARTVVEEIERRHLENIAAEAARREREALEARDLEVERNDAARRQSRRKVGAP